MREDLDEILAERGADALLVYSESVRNPNMYYLTNFLAPDPFILLKKTDRPPIMVVNSMEFPRAQNESAVKDVKSYVDYGYLGIIKGAKTPKLGVMKFLASVVEKELGKGTTISVPHDFPSIATDVLRREGLTIKPMFNVIEKARETKEADEIDEVRRVQEVVEKITKETIDLMADCDVGPKNTLICKADGRKKALTVGDVKSLMGHRFLDDWCVVEGELIVACGPSSANPHYHGAREDTLKANQPIILDIYPRSVRRRYWTDMTRTVVKGRASRAVKSMFDAVLEAKNACMDALHEGVYGSEMFNLCCNLLEKAGYNTIRGGKQIQKGFTHGLGHGVGLEIHEGPSMSEVYKFPLREHNILTVEPGLYDPKIGGVRIEDIVEVGKKGCNNLTKMYVQLEI
ncbi:MAG: aminopeptidase P family protein [Candidatus Bathyarchaeota archaeon]|nr:MAG: aminopeptidase P family protein [Candidatus Bathyarchaeota archaeon]